MEGTLLKPINQKRPLVSIIIDNYNYGKFLRKAIDSALSQTYHNTEVIVVDDGSNDNSLEMIARYGDKIMPVLKNNGGQASALNMGFDVSRGELICFLDADDFFSHNKVNRIVELFESNQFAGWVYHRLEFVDECGCPLPSKQTLGIPAIDFIDVRNELIMGNRLHCMRPATSGLCFRRNILKHILPMPEAIKITSDEFVKHAALYLSPGIYSSEKLAFQRIHGGNAYTFHTGIESLRSEVVIKTSFYLRDKFHEISRFTDKRFASSLGRLIGIEGFMSTAKCYESREYMARYFVFTKWLIFAPRIIFNIIKGLIIKIKR